MASSAERLGALAHEALVVEARLTPKPGLVDAATNGAHDDMDLPLLLRSADTIAPWFARFHQRAAEEARAAGAGAPLPVTLRVLGVACEAAMLAATGGVNTHKGAIYAFGLVTAAAGWLEAAGSPITTGTVCAQVADWVAPTLAQELGGSPGTVPTAGQRLHRALGLTGARGEAASGFARVREAALPAYRSVHAAGGDDDTALHQAMLVLLADNEDTNLANDGGLPAIRSFQTEARALLAAGGALAPGYADAVTAWDARATAAGLSPGGSADLLALTWFFAKL